MGALGRPDLGRGNGKEQEHPAAAAIGVMRVMSASSLWQPELSTSGARASSKVHIVPS
jgi:hypothetical protein